MRTARKNRQPLKYALYLGKKIREETDDNGEIIYDDNGEPLLSGVPEATYGRAVDFTANIAFASGEAEAEAYGVGIGDYDSKIILPKGALPITETSLIFKDSQPKYDSKGRLIEKSADFRVLRKADSLNYTVYLLKHIEK